MKLPNRNAAVIDPEKLRDYLLSQSHPVGRFKSVFFASIGYSCDLWQQLAIDLREQHLPNDVYIQKESPYGTKYEIRANLETPTGRSVQLVSIWIVLAEEDFPRFVTAYPGVKQ